ncbi:MAG: hypothetical protein HY063_03790 [Bacteroidetes bacterium]|nr:hypothetical protein [Bacteroidota bacterium]
MTKKIIVLDAPVKAKDKTPVWWKLGKYFIHQENIRSIKRKGKGTAITFFHGDDLLVNVKYDKLEILLPSDKNAV